MAGQKMMAPEFNQQDKNSRNLEQLAKIGVALSVEKNIDKLLEMILDAARSLSNADAGTLYIIDEEQKNLRFEILQNETMKTRISGKNAGDRAVPPPVPLYIDNQPNNSNVSSYAALTGRTVNIDNVYEDSEFNFTGPRSFDSSTGYHTKSMLVIPMLNHEYKIIGVLQLINAKDPVNSMIVSFSQEDINFVSSLASQAAVALTNAQLIGKLLSDITEITELQHSEMELGRKLREAYLKTEESNKELQTALKKVQMIRIAATIFIIVLFIAVGLYSWNKKLLPGKKAGSAAVADRKQAVSDIIRVAPKYIASSLYLTGTLEPLYVVNITSPIYGKVKEIQFHYGDIVKAGQVLLKMDTSEVEVRHREAKAAYIRAVERLKEVEKWEESQDAMRARRSLTKAKLSLDMQKQTFEETERLFKKGLVPATELAWAKQQYTSQQLDYQSAQDELNATLVKGNEDGRNIARLEMENAKTRLKDLEQQLAYSTVVAPISGVIMLPGSVFEARDARMLEKGSPLQEGGIILSIGDLSGFSVKARVDEVDITKVAAGQKVNVTGDAFPGVALTGRISTLSSQGNLAQGTGSPFFEMKVSIDKITDEQKQGIFVGMSSNLEVLTYEKDDALTVPVAAVMTEGEKRFVKRKKPGNDKNAPIEKVEVQTGYTTYDYVEITGGLKSGDEILVDKR